MIRVQALCIDSERTTELARFWEAALGWRRTQDEPDEVVIEPPAGSAEDGVAPDILFLKVPEQKSVKNCLHIDLRPDDQQAEVERLLALGARRVEIRQSDDPRTTWEVLADQAGNEFCVLKALGAGTETVDGPGTH
jgi:hypothetical protein